MKPDISNKEDIHFIVTLFYEQVKVDEEIGLFFSKVTPVNWDKHVPLMCSFWENVLFYTGDYEGNPLVTHKEVNAKASTSNIHFQRWNDLFQATILQYFEGPNAEKMIHHALAISSVMQQKMV